MLSLLGDLLRQLPLFVEHTAEDVQAARWIVSLIEGALLVGIGDNRLTSVVIRI